MISKGTDQISFKDIQYVPQEDILKSFLPIRSIPCLISNPMREDRNPSLSIFYGNNKDILYKDFSTGDTGNIYKLLTKVLKCSYKELYRKIKNEIKGSIVPVTKNTYKHRITDIRIKEREYKDYDIQYWKEYGIDIELLKWANIYPISHFSIHKGTNSCIFPSSKYSYAFVEFVLGIPYIKIYQPFSKRKWYSNFPYGTISLLNKIPEKGEKLIICSSLKDCLTIISSTKIPSICPQGEGYNIDSAVIEDLKKRYNKIYVLYDNDETGLYHGKRIADSFSINNIVLPNIGSKDVSDLYKQLNNKQKFIQLITSLL